MRIALFQPDIPQNTGTILRTAACLNLPVDIIGPTGFDLSDRALRRAGLDYLERANFELHTDFENFAVSRLNNGTSRLILATTAAEQRHLDFRFDERDILLFGRESSGAPDWLHKKAAARIRIPMHDDARSLNLAISAAIIVGEALRQTGGFSEL